MLDKLNSPGSTDTYVDTGLSVGTRYYAAFARDNLYNYAAGANAMCAVGVSGDFDADGDVDMEDFGHLQACYGRPISPNCADTNFNSDNAVDQLDANVFLNCLGGPSRSPGC